MRLAARHARIYAQLPGERPATSRLRSRAAIARFAGGRDGRSGIVSGSPRNDLWKQMLGLVAEIKPKAFLLENVPGMVHWKQGEFGAHVLKEFGKLGYAVSKDILLAADYGIPQRRRRLFIIGILGDEPLAFPQKTHLGGWRRDYLGLWEKKRKEQGLLRHIRAWEALGDLPEATTDGKVTAVPDPGRLTPFARRMRGGRRTGVITLHAPSPIPAAHLDLIAHVPQGGTWRDIPRHLLPDATAGCVAPTARISSVAWRRTSRRTRSPPSSTTSRRAASRTRTTTAR